MGDAAEALAWLPRRADGGPLRIGHRGAAGLAPANTLAALEAALGAGLDGIEFDVVSAGGRLVLAHSGAERTRESPELDDALALLARRAPTGLLVDLDLKSPGAEAEVLAALRRHGLVGQALLSSFHADALRVARVLEPGLRTGVSYPDDRLGLSRRGLPDAAIGMGLAALRRALPFRVARMIRRAGADAAMLHHEVLSPAAVAACRRAGGAVFAWTVNDAAALERVVSLGVDGVITDEPAVFGPS